MELKAWLNDTWLGDCRSERLVEDFFGSVSEFAALCEENNDNFIYRGVKVVYDEKADIHNFYREQTERLTNKLKKI